MSSLDRTIAAQSAAKAVMAELAASVTSVDTERTIVERAIACLKTKGICATWYYDCPALVLLGSRSCVSISGRDYVPSDETVGEFNVVTVDLSPLLDGVAGDFARSLCVENGEVTCRPATTSLSDGLMALEELHQHLVDLSQPDMTFGQLFSSLTERLAAFGWENLDLHGNFGHTLTTQLHERCFIEAGSSLRMIDAAPFTFEPHVRLTGDRWGFKREDVYAFGDNDDLVAL